MSRQKIEKSITSKKRIGDLTFVVNPYDRKQRFVYSRFLIALARLRSSSDPKTALVAITRYFLDNQLILTQLDEFVKTLTGMIEGDWGQNSSLALNIFALFAGALKLTEEEFDKLLKLATSTLTFAMTEEVKDIVNLLVDAAAKMNVELPPETLLCKDDAIERYRKSDGGDVYVVYLCHENRRFAVKIDASAELKRQVRQIHRQLTLIYDELNYPPPLPQDVRLFRELVMRFLVKRADYEVELEKLAVKIAENISKHRSKIYDNIEQAKQDPSPTQIFYIVAERKFYVAKQALRKILEYKNYVKELEKMKELGILEEVRPRMRLGRAQYYVFDAEKFSDIIGYDVMTEFTTHYTPQDETPHQEDNRQLEL